MSLTEEMREGVESVVAGAMGSAQCLLNGWVLTANYINPDGEQATAVTVAEGQALPTSMAMVLYASTWFDVLQRDRFKDAIAAIAEEEDEDDPDVQGF
jgi:hypothetical protein